MSPSRQSVLLRQDQADQKSDPTLFTEYPPSSSSRYQLTTNKVVFGLPVTFLGFMLSLGLISGAALASCECDEQILGKEYCDSFIEQCRRYMTNLEEHKREVNKSGYDICNKSSRTAYAAYASAYEGYGYERKGWYTIDPGSCKRILTESMTNKTYYVRIEDRNGKSWTKADEKFCMWPPQSNGKIFTASLKQCRAWKVGNKSFQKVRKGQGFIRTIR